MYGCGRGVYLRLEKKALVNERTKLTISYLSRFGLLTDGARQSINIRGGGRVHSFIHFEVNQDTLSLQYWIRLLKGGWGQASCDIQLEKTPCHYGGYRTWFNCPADGCGRRVSALYSGRIFACRQCHELVYLSQRENSVHRDGSRLNQIRKRLGWKGGVMFGHGKRPKGMHQRTFDRLVAEHEKLAQRFLPIYAATQKQVQDALAELDELDKE